MFRDNVALDTACEFMWSETLTPASVGAAVGAEQAFTPAAAPRALKATDLVSVSGPGTGNATALCGARVNATGQIVLAWANPTAGALTPAAGAHLIHVRRI